MCVILIGNVTREQYETALAQNRDGCSLFTRELGLIKAPTRADVNRAIGDFGIWHFRIASSGKINKSNIHPFQICKGRYLLYHNGVLGNGLDDLSDTAALAETLYQVNLTTARSVIRSLSHGQRFVIADAKDPQNFELFGDWSAEAGVIMSHKLYKPSYGRGGSVYGLEDLYK